MKNFKQVFILISAIILISSNNIFSITSSPDSLADQLYQKGDDFWRDVKYDSSNYFYEKASELFEKSEDWIKYIDCQKNMGINYRYLGDYTQSFTHLNNALGVIKNITQNQDSLRAEIYNSIGTVYYEKANYDKAYKYYSEMLQINEKIFGTENANTGKGYHNVGLIYYRTGDYEKALQYFEKAETIWIKTLGRNNTFLANCYTNMSNVYFLKEDYNKSIEYDLKALNIWEDKLGSNHPFVAMSYNNLASTYTYTGNYDKALEYNYKAMQIRRDFAGEESRDVAYSYANIGDVFTRMGNLNNGKYFLNKAISIYRKIDPFNPNLAEAYIFSGNLYRKKTEFTNAEAYYDSALSIVWPGHSPDSADVNTLQKMPSEDQLVTALIEKGNTFEEDAEHSGETIKLIKALNAYKITSDVIDKLKVGFGREESKLMLTKRSYEVNKKAIGVALNLYKKTDDKKYLESAFLFTERNKAGILAESIAESDARKFAGLPDSLLEEEKDLRADLSLYQTRLEEAEESQDSISTVNNRNLLFDFQRKYDDLLSYIEQNFPAYHKLKYPDEISSTEDIKKLLPDKAALLEYSIGDSSITIFALAGNSENVVSVKSDSTFFYEVRKFRNSLQKLDYISYLTSSVFLYNKLIMPVKGSITGKEKLYIIPDDIMAYLPFEALLANVSTETFNGDFTGLHYLINDYEISYHYSSELLRETLLHKNDNAKISFAGFAPVFSEDKNDLKKIASVMDSNLVNDNALRSIIVSGKKYSSLPETETEVKSIGKLFKEAGYPSDLFLNKSATESTLKSDDMYRYKFIHLATHGFINEEHPNLSGLIFYNSDDSLDDGILYAGEIYNLNLNADLIVLSACESGLGKVVKGEGIFGLTRGFFYAGADNIVVSLWQVADKSTSILMINFYKNILDGMDYSSALRKAKLDLINTERYSYPLEWSPFILVGR